MNTTSERTGDSDRRSTCRSRHIAYYVASHRDYRLYRIRLVSLRYLAARHRVVLSLSALDCTHESVWHWDLKMSFRVGTAFY